MLSLSPKSGYAVMAVSYLVGRETTWVLGKRIATDTGIPQPYLSKILHSLVRAGIVSAKRGSTGGFCLAIESQNITMLQVVEAVEGKAWAPNCFLGLGRRPGLCICPVDRFWQEERERIISRLRQTTMAEISRSRRAPSGKGSCLVCVTPDESESGETLHQLGIPPKAGHDPHKPA